ncbi:MAG: phosphorylase [Coxiella sp. (in: Bacteria)]|nr:MAG: phosphorylase [Coxiella sp. (in: g-proteobacteria)]
MYIKESELVFNQDGSIYHLNLHPEELANMVILVGDPGRVPRISRYFDCIEVVKERREFLTHTGYMGNQRVSVISTGIGVGSIDVVINELDALVNVDFKTRKAKEHLTQLQLVRLGTCGGLQSHMQLHDIVYSSYAFAFDGLLDFYRQTLNKTEAELLAAVTQHFKGLPVLSSAYVTESTLPLAKLDVKRGVTLTCAGFFGPQCRSVRAPLMDFDFFECVQSFHFKDLPVLNFEMETAPILALGHLLGHHCASLSTVVANRVTHEFSKDTDAAVTQLIECFFEQLA